MDSDDSVGFGHAFVSILAAGLLAVQCLFVWGVAIAAVLIVVNDIGFIAYVDEPQTYLSEIAEVVVPVGWLIANLVVAPWIAWTYLRTGARRPSRQERFGAGFIVGANFAWVLWYGLAMSFWPPDLYDSSLMVLAALIAILVTSISFSHRPVGLSAR